MPFGEQKRLRAHFGFTRLPFRKNVGADAMFDSSSQRELHQGLCMWMELRGIALVTGATGVGKSITMRRFLRQLPESRYKVLHFGQIPTTRAGFLRALCRRLELRPRQHIADMFDDARACLHQWHTRHQTVPLLVMDDAEGMKAATLDLVRRLTAGELDAEDRVAILLTGTDRLLRALEDPVLAPLRNRFTYARSLRAFSVEDTHNYIRFHLDHAEASHELFTDDARSGLFHASAGVPRAINQLALQALIDAAVRGIDQVDGRLMKQVIRAHPLYASSAGRR